MKESKKMKSRSWRLFKKACLAAAVCAAAGLAAVSALGASDSQETEDSSLSEEEEGLIEYNGVRYVPKKNIETYLFMGIDDTKTVQKKTEYDGTGQCDMLYLMVRDISEGTYRTMPLDRNTMTDVKSLDVDGTYLATTRNQLALAHANGDGMEISCENTVDAVSNLLYGQEIDGYAAVNMGAIGTINNLVGGVTVTIEDDFSETDPTLVQGETVTLTDEQAVHFVHDRQNVADGTNENRISRQNQYLTALEPMLKELCSSDASFPNTVYDALQDYMVTNIPKKKFSKIALLLAKEEDEGRLTITGTSEIGDMDYIEFTPDEDSLMEAVLTLFYKEYKY